MKKVKIFTDGACKNNPGPGGWAAILRYDNIEKKISGFVPHTTNNRMELLALINALKLLNNSCDVHIFSDSKYVVDSINKKWAFKWKEDNWKRNNKDVPNSDLWDTLIGLLSYHRVRLSWEKGHSGNPENEECDYMATNQIKKYISS